MVGDPGDVRKKKSFDGVVFRRRRADLMRRRAKERGVIRDPFRGGELKERASEKGHHHPLRIGNCVLEKKKSWGRVTSAIWGGRGDGL